MSFVCADHLYEKLYKWSDLQIVKECFHTGSQNGRTSSNGDHFSEFHTANKCIIQSRGLCRTDVESLRSTTFVPLTPSNSTLHRRAETLYPKLSECPVKTSFFLLISFPEFWFGHFTFSCCLLRFTSCVCFPLVTQAHLFQVCPASRPDTCTPAPPRQHTSWSLAPPPFLGAYQIVCFASRLSAPVLPSVGDLMSLLVHLLLHTEWVHLHLSR